MTGQSGGGGGTPSGTAGGVLGGTYPSPTFATNGTTPILGVVQSKLTSAVVMTLANTFYDGPSVNLTAGTWLLVGSVAIGNGASGGIASARLWDGAVSYASFQVQYAAANLNFSFSVSGVVTVASTATVRIAAASTGTTFQMNTDVSNNSGQNTGCTLFAVRIA